MQIGFIGLGNLGAPIAENLLEQHPGMFVYNRTEAKAKPLAEKGAKVCNNVKELASACDVIFTIVSNDAAISGITKGENGIAANLKENGIHISMSTILPATSEDLFKIHEQYKNHYIACPVSGRPEAARAKKLNFMISGDKAIADIVKPLLNDAGATGIWEYGNAPGNANAAKLCTNYMIMAAMQAMAEGISLAKKSSIDETMWMKMLTSTLFNCGIYINYGNFILKEAYKPAAFSLELGLKDANLVMKQAEAIDSKMFIGKLIQQQLQHLFDKGYGDHDWSALALSVK
ncbi:MAG TPA: NAD(P)-dependent oxidoreductase [Parafilimonas sp.]|nr:NAD(P)-dependent oxidoreductase [Parafilimonas sp.]